MSCSKSAPGRCIFLVKPHKEVLGVEVFFPCKYSHISQPQIIKYRFTGIPFQFDPVSIRRCKDVRNFGLMSDVFLKSPNRSDNCNLSFSELLKKKKFWERGCDTVADLDLVTALRKRNLMT